jgi:hypothetical protein
MNDMVSIRKMRPLPAESGWRDRLDEIGIGAVARSGAGSWSEVLLRGGKRVV